MLKQISFITAALFLPITALAVTSPWQSNPQGRVRLVAPYVVANDHGHLILGVHFQMQPGWDVYWKDPGDSGMPPKFTWDGSTGFTNAQTLWPAPHRYVLPGNLIAYGYKDEVVYPIRADLTGNPKTIHAVAHVYYLTCKESCVPHKYTLTLDIPTGTPVKDPFDEEIYHLMVPFYELVPVEDRQNLNDTPFLTPPIAAVPATVPNTSPLLFFVLAAFLGGLILNVMPCVLPVLSIKLFGLLKNSDKSRSAAVVDSLASAGGIIFSFGVLGAAAVLLRKTGHAIGWGIQFQQPVFVALLAVVVFVFALNLWGVFEIGLPRIFGRFAETYGGGESLLAYFTSGIFATLLATPCSAPFLGTAMGFALTQSAPTIILIFLTAGTGMAFPYLALAVFPGALKLLPKPGAWMVRLRQFFAIVLAGTGLWLVSILYLQLSHPAQTTVEDAGHLVWTPFDESAIAADLKTGKSVFVDVTAAWCFTCKYNERFVLESPKVAAVLGGPDIVLQRADWTNPDAAIDAFLKRYGRAGIPFYVLFRPDGSTVLLSELLTPEKVLQAFAYKRDK